MKLSAVVPGSVVGRELITISDRSEIILFGRGKH